VILSSRARRRAALNALLVCSLLFVARCAAFGQGSPAERAFNASKDRVDEALQSLRSSASGRLPTLDGFVDPTDSLDHYERGYYQCEIVSTATASGETSVRVTAKITAWYADPTGVRPGYRSLVSNGRIESDFLDNLAEALGAKSPVPRPSPPARPTNAPTTPRPSEPASAPSAKASAVATPTSASAPSPAPTDGKSTAVAAGASLESIRQQREAVEQQFQEVSSQVQNFEQIRQSQTHPDDILVVKKSRTPVYGKPDANAEVLMTAEQGDEFSILDIQGGWVHVGISGPSRGWMRRVEVDVPNEYPGAGGSSDAAPLFRVSREDVSPFAGTWGLLKDKVVKIIWVAPIDANSPATPPRAKREYAKSLFLKELREIVTDPQAVAGVVVVFDSADGGQIAATVTSVKKLSAGQISDEDFWKECSLDPPEAFQDPTNQ